MTPSKLLIFNSLASSALIMVSGYEVTLQVAQGETRDWFVTVPWIAIWVACILIGISLIREVYHYETQNAWEDYIAEQVGPILFVEGV
jgi:divalent metal cation (Fe/Co/Zn/Cd) transporter